MIFSRQKISLDSSCGAAFLKSILFSWIFSLLVFCIDFGYSNNCFAHEGAKPEYDPKNGGAVSGSVPLLKGINLASGEFAPGRLPGRYGYDYVYPTLETAAPFVNAGFTMVRLPILWERLQPSLGRPFSDVEISRIDDLVNAMRDFEIIVLDIHNYGSYLGQRIDSTPALKLAFSDLWMRIANRYKSSPKIAFGLMNEPNGMSARSARELATVAITAIRDTGAKNLVLVPGTRWTGAHSWTIGGIESNATAFADFRDPANNFFFDLHQYLDADSSGTHPDCVNPDVGVDRLSSVTDWLRNHKQQAILGEFGAGPSSVCLIAMRRMLAFMEANPDVWRGWTYWAGGAWWGDYFLGIQPNKGVMKPQMKVLLEFIKP